eukprot:TRINITY_DN12692_c0_g1_i1.p1 TRINITY_DN12692_c0_g1~~TRINITY_DN12692_c0_g1_i1.p1  ORF type:complete len:725 (+),score=62.69 TRINITY_DN12692_c0_g1_i1:91-2265(+)
MDANKPICTICLADLNVKNKRAHTLQCEHTFHVDCILDWVRRDNKTCPICRRTEVALMPVPERYARGKEMFENGQYMDAAREMEQILLTHSSHVNAMRLYALCLWLSGSNIYQARTCFEDAMNRGDVHAAVCLGYMNLKGIGGFKRPKIAYDLFNTAAESGDPALAAEVGRLAFSLNMKDAAAALTIAFPHSLHPARVALYAGHVWMKRGNTSKALKLYEKSSSLGHAEAAAMAGILRARKAVNYLELLYATYSTNAKNFYDDFLRGLQPFIGELKAALEMFGKAVSGECTHATEVVALQSRLQRDVFCVETNIAYNSGRHWLHIEQIFQHPAHYVHMQHLHNMGYCSNRLCDYCLSPDGLTTGSRICNSCFACIELRYAKAVLKSLNESLNDLILKLYEYPTLDAVEKAVGYLTFYPQENRWALESEPSTSKTVATNPSGSSSDDLQAGIDASIQEADDRAVAQNAQAIEAIRTLAPSAASQLEVCVMKFKQWGEWFQQSFTSSSLDSIRREPEPNGARIYIQPDEVYHAVVDDLVDKDIYSRLYERHVVVLRANVQCIMSAVENACNETTYKQRGQHTVKSCTSPKISEVLVSLDQNLDQRLPGADVAQGAPASSTDPLVYVDQRTRESTTNRDVPVDQDTAVVQSILQPTVGVAPNTPVPSPSPGHTQDFSQGSDVVQSAPAPPSTDRLLQHEVYLTFVTVQVESSMYDKLSVHAKSAPAP